MDIRTFEVEAEDIALVAQYALAEAFDAYRHDNSAQYERAMEVGVALEGLAAMGGTAGDYVRLAEQAEQYGMKTAEDIRSLATRAMMGVMA